MHNIITAAAALLLLAACAGPQITQREDDQCQLSAELVAGAMDAPSERARKLLLKQCHEAAMTD
jgi:hypothetical protein